MMQELTHSDDQLVNQLKEDLLKVDEVCEKPKFPNIRVVMRSISVPDIVDEDDKVGKKRPRKNDVSGDKVEVKIPTKKDELETIPHSDGDEWGNELEDPLKDVEEYEEPKSPKKRLVKKSVSVPELVVKDEEDLDDYRDSTSGLNEKVGNKRQRKNDVSVYEKKRQKKDDVLSGLEKTKKKKKQEEVEDMWDFITNDKNSEEGDKVKAKLRKKEDVDEAQMREQTLLEENSAYENAISICETKIEEKRKEYKVAMGIAEALDYLHNNDPV